jgi:hypothetical protein
MLNEQLQSHLSIAEDNSTKTRIRCKSMNSGQRIAMRDIVDRYYASYLVRFIGFIRTARSGMNKREASRALLTFPFCIFFLFFPNVSPRRIAREAQQSRDTMSPIRSRGRDAPRVCFASRVNTVLHANEIAHICTRGSRAIRSFLLPLAFLSSGSRRCIAVLLRDCGIFFFSEEWLS